MNKEKIINILKNAAAIVVFCALLTIILYQNRDRDIFGLRAKETGNEHEQLYFQLKRHHSNLYSHCSGMVFNEARYFNKGL